MLIGGYISPIIHILEGPDFTLVISGLLPCLWGGVFLCIIIREYVHECKSVSCFVSVSASMHSANAAFIHIYEMKE